MAGRFNNPDAIASYVKQGNHMSLQDAEEAIIVLLGYVNALNAAAAQDHTRIAALEDRLNRANIPK